jgi:hypothetical protein
MMIKTPVISASTMMTGKTTGAHGAVGCSVIAAARASVVLNSTMFVAFCIGYVTGRCGTHFTSCSLAAAMRLPVTVRYPRMISAVSAIILNVVRCSGASENCR